MVRFSGGPVWPSFHLVAIDEVLVRTRDLRAGTAGEHHGRFLEGDDLLESDGDLTTQWNIVDEDRGHLVEGPDASVGRAGHDLATVSGIVGTDEVHLLEIAQVMVVDLVRCVGHAEAAAVAGAAADPRLHVGAFGEGREGEGREGELGLQHAVLGAGAGRGEGDENEHEGKEAIVHGRVLLRKRPCEIHGSLREAQRLKSLWEKSCENGR